MSDPSDSPVDRFLAQFWKARQTQMGSKDNAEQAKEEYREAIRLATEANLPAEVEFVEAAILETDGKLDEAVDRSRAALARPDVQLSGLGWFLVGSVLEDKNQFDEAIAAYEKASDAPGLLSLGIASYNMGNAYVAKGEYDLAIECCQKALDDPKYDKPGMAWNNMGNTYWAKGEYDRAIECLQKALDDPKHKMSGKAWYNMGLAYQAKGETGRAVECWQKAEEAAKAGNMPSLASAASVAIRTAQLRPEERSAQDEAVLKWSSPAGRDGETVDSPEARIFAKLTRQTEDQYQQYQQKPESGLDDVLAVLRGWGSAVTLTEDASGLCRGGGYFLKWRGKGLVIDPGFDFLHNFHEAGFHAREWHVVAVTHNHTDHNADLRALDDIRYELYTREAEPAKRDDLRHFLLLDEDTKQNARLDAPQSKHRAEVLLLDWHRRRVMPNDAIDLRPQKIPFVLRCFQACHTPDVPGAVGLRVECYDEDPQKRPVVIGFSGDTEYFRDLSNHLSDCDILLAHMSQPDFEELNDPNHFKKGHLGYRGTAELIRGSKPRLAIVGEFWAGLADVRIELIQGLRALCGSDAILPGGLNLFVHPRDLTIRCNACKEWVPLGKISVTPPDRPFGPLKYVCQRCRL